MNNAKVEWNVFQMCALSDGEWGAISADWLTVCLTVTNLTILSVVQKKILHSHYSWRPWRALGRDLREVIGTHTLLARRTNILLCFSQTDKIEVMWISDIVTFTLWQISDIVTTFPICLIDSQCNFSTAMCLWLQSGVKLVLLWELSQKWPKLADWAVHGWSSCLAAMGA